MSTVETIGNASLIRVGNPSQSPIYNYSQQVAVIYAGNTVPLFWRNGPRYEVSGANRQTALQAEVIDGSIYLLEKSEPTFSYQVYKHDIITGMLTGYWDASIRNWSTGTETADARAIYGFPEFNARFQQFRSDFSGIFDIPGYGNGSINSDLASGSSTSSASESRDIVITSPLYFGIDNASIITSLNARTQKIQIDIDSFDGGLGKLKIASTRRQLRNLASTETGFIHDRRLGYLYYNENGTQSGFGNGGVVAILEGKPKVNSSSFEFI